MVKEGKKSLTLFWSKEFCEFYQITKNLFGFEIPLPKPDNYDVYLDNEGSINNLIGKIERKEIDLNNSSKQVANRAIIVTTSPIMENIINKENFIIQMNHFQMEHDRYLRYLLEKIYSEKFTIIIYHIKHNVIPEGLYTSLNWPVFWIESITDSPLSKFRTNEIVEYIRFKTVYKEKKGDFYHKIFREIYNDVDSHYEYHIDNDKVDEILNFIYMKLKKMRKRNGELVLDAINFNDLIDKFEGKTIKDSYINLDFKREFYNTIINQIPLLKHIIQVLILNQSVINKNSISDTKVFISNLFKENFEQLFKIADHYNTNSLYFPEFIIQQVRSIYEVIIKGTKIFKELYNIQIDIAYLVKYFSDKLIEIVYDIEYKKEVEMKEKMQFKDDELKRIKNQKAKIKQENEIVIKENTEQKKKINILSKKAEELNVQLAKKIKKFNLQLETKEEENKNLTKQLEELNKKNEEFEIIKNQNVKIKQENEIIIKENAEQKKTINILIKKAKVLNSQLANKTKEFNKQLRTKAEKLKKLQNQLDELLKQTNGETIKVLDSNTIKNLEIIEEIGFGGGGKVLKVAKKEFYALKIMNVDKNSDNYSSLRNFMNEYEIMNMLNHPNILKTYGIFLSDEKNPPSILLEFCPTNLSNALKNKALSKVQIICSIYQIVEGMKYVHFRKIIPRDLKPTNILIAEDGKIRIGDFGIAKLMSAEQQLTTGGLGTQKFVAPEIINEENYNEKADVYSFGVLVYTLLNDGKLPVIKLRDICIGKKAEIPPNFTVFSKNLINACWNFQPENRPSFEMILNDLERNKYSLIKLTKSELFEVEDFVNKHKSLIPCYSKV